MMTEHTLDVSDIQQLQQEMGMLESQLRLRSIIAERRCRELSARVAELELALSSLQEPDNVYGQ